MQAQQQACQLLRSLAALARQLPQYVSSRSGAQQISSRLPALLPPVLQQPARFSTSPQAHNAWQHISSRLAALHPQQQRLWQQPLRSWKHHQQPWQHLHRQTGCQLLQSRSMATRVEQQAAANPGKAGCCCSPDLPGNGHMFRFHPGISTCKQAGLVCMWLGWPTLTGHDRIPPHSSTISKLAYADGVVTGPFADHRTFVHGSCLIP